MIPKSINRVILPKVYITKDRFEDLISVFSPQINGSQTGNQRKSDRE